MATKKTTPKKPATKAKAKSQTTAKAKAKPRAQAKKSAAKPQAKNAKKSTTNTKRGGSRALLETSAKRGNNSPANALKALTKVPMLKTKSANVRTQPNNPILSDSDSEQILNAFNAIREVLESVAANLRQLDRSRLNGVGIKRQGFIERSFALAAENTHFLPQYLSIDQFQQSFEYFITLRSLLDACTQLREFIWNMVVQAADITFTDSGEFYKAVQEAARRRIDGAESIFRELSPFFKHGTRRNEEGEAVETMKQQLRDAKGILKGTKQGKFFAENIKPKITGGKHEVIDETFRDKASFKESEEGEITE